MSSLENSILVRLKQENPFDLEYRNLKLNEDKTAQVTLSNNETYLFSVEHAKGNLVEFDSAKWADIIKKTMTILLDFKLPLQSLDSADILFHSEKAGKAAKPGEIFATKTGSHKQIHKIIEKDHPLLVQLANDVKKVALPVLRTESEPSIHEDEVEDAKKSDNNKVNSSETPEQDDLEMELKYQSELPQNERLRKPNKEEALVEEQSDDDIEVRDAEGDLEEVDNGLDNEDEDDDEVEVRKKLTKSQKQNLTLNMSDITADEPKSSVDTRLEAAVHISKAILPPKSPLSDTPKSSSSSTHPSDLSVELVVKVDESRSFNLSNLGKTPFKILKSELIPFGIVLYKEADKQKSEISFESLEQAYQYLRFYDDKSFIRSDISTDILEKYDNGREVRDNVIEKLKKKKIIENKNWASKKDEVLYFLTYQKFKQNKVAWEDLKKTQDKVIIVVGNAEDNETSESILMDVRDHILAEENLKLMTLELIAKIPNKLAKDREMIGKELQELLRKAYKDDPDFSRLVRQTYGPITVIMTDTKNGKNNLVGEFLQKLRDGLI